MGDAKNLSFSTGFNYLKYPVALSGSTDISLAVYGDTTYTVGTGLSRQTTFRAFIEVSGIMYDLFSTAFDGADLDIWAYAYFDSSNDVNFRIVGGGGSAPAGKIHYRIYIDQ